MGWYLSLMLADGKLRNTLTLTTSHSFLLLWYYLHMYPPSWI